MSKCTAKVRIFSFTIVMSLLGSVILGQVNVLTQHNDNSRTGANLNEIILNRSNVNVNQFGKLFSRTVDGQIYAQPLYVENVNTGQGRRNVVCVATMNNSVYAFDADDPGASTPLWQINLGPPVPIADTDGGRDIHVPVGITSTPVIDPVAGILYCVAKTKEGSLYFQRLHALDITTGQERLGGPVVIEGSVPGTGDGSAGSSIAFNALRHLNRPGLLLLNGYLYIAFGSHEDVRPYHGWVFRYDAATLQRIAIFNTTPGSWGGATWQSGQGLAADDSGNVYFMTANGAFDANTGGQNMSSCFIKLGGQSLNLVDWFAPYNADNLNAANQDLASAGPLMLPGTNFLVGGGKEGVFHVLDRNNMGRFQAGSNSQIVQNFQATNGRIYGSPVYWNSPEYGPLVFVWGENDYLKAFRLVNGLFQGVIATSTMTASAGVPGAMLSISANGSASGTGIVWGSMPFSGNANTSTVPGILRAFDASNVAVELWNSLQNSARDDLGSFAKFCPPTVANGKVYLATFSNELVVYGPNPPSPPPGSGIRFVQVAAATPQSASTVSVTYPFSQNAGDLNVVVVGWNDSTSSVQSVTDSKGNTYTVAIGPTTGNHLRQSIYFAKNITGGSNTVTVIFNQTVVYPDIRILEYSGVDTVSPLDATAGAAGIGINTDSGFAMTTSANGLIFGANTVSTHTAGPGPGFTSRIITSPDGDIAEDKIVTAAGAYSATAPLSSIGSWVMQMATFRASGPASAPTVSGVSPNSGSTSGGTSVTIMGKNFAGGAAVSLGGSAATNVVVVNSTTITGSTPAHAAGAVSVTVTNTDTQSGTLSNGFTYSLAAPTVTSVSPNSGPTTGGIPVTVTGTNFARGAAVSFGGSAATVVVVVNSTTITANIPARAAGAVSVTVTNTDAQSGTLTNGFTYTFPAPTISNVSPNSSTEDAFVSSAARGDVRAVELSLTSGLSPNARNRDGFTPLMWSAGQGHPRVVERLLEKGAEINATSKDATTALMTAASQGHTQIARLLIDKGADVDAKRADGWTALTWSAAEGQDESVRLLLARGARIDASDSRGITPLIYAAANMTDEIPNDKTLPVVQTLLSNGARVDFKAADGSTALMWAAKKGEEGIVEVLLAKGANVNARDKDGKTPLIYAAVGKAPPPVAEALIRRGADINMKDSSGITALMRAAQRRKPGMLKALLANGADPNAIDNQGTSALMIAAQMGRTDNLKALLEGRADTSLKDKKGRTAADIALENHQNVILAFLRNEPR